MKIRYTMLTIVLVISLSLVMTAGYASADEHGMPQSLSIEDTDMVVGFDRPSVGWAKANEQGQIIGYRGICLLLGYSEKRYFEPLKMGEFNPYWGFGTASLIMPFVEVGGDYPFARRDDGSFFTVGGALAVHTYWETPYLIPLPRISISYHF